MVRMSTHSHMETVLSSILHQILVGSNTSSFQSLRGQLPITPNTYTHLLTLVRKHMANKRISVHRSRLVTNIENTNLGVYSSTPTHNTNQELHGRSET